MTSIYDCPKCGADMRMQVQATISAPSSMYHNLSKRNIRSKDCYLMGVNWETADMICMNQLCGHFIDGYGNYVTKLEHERDEFLKSLKIVQQERDEALRSVNLPEKPSEQLVSDIMAALSQSGIRIKSEDVKMIYKQIIEKTK